MTLHRPVPEVPTQVDLRGFIAHNRAGEAVGMPSICSSHRDVLFASALLAKSHGVPLLVEATSNQVNQFGGYTGMRPADFKIFVQGICDAADLDWSQVILGGDHLGPQAWRHEDAETAMAKACDLVRDYVTAGFTKIHLDCSEGCLGEPPQVSDRLSAERSASLARVCEESAGNRHSLLYVVGTEVPPPGGARAGEDMGIMPTSAKSARNTLAVQQQEFEKQVSTDAWNRVIGLVVQPGLEFGATDVHHFDIKSSDALSEVLTGYPHLAFEAHSTDYQNDDVYPQLARRHFAVLKVGPALTFAYRQAIYALDAVSRWYGRAGQPRLAETMERLMMAQPAYWSNHYTGDDDELHRLRHFGYADRIRYYWNHQDAETNVEAILTCLDGHRLDRPLLQQHFSISVIERARGLASDRTGLARALVLSQVQEALLPYFTVSRPCSIAT